MTDTVAVPEKSKPAIESALVTDEQVLEAIEGAAWMGKSLVIYDREKIEGNRDKDIRPIRRRNLSASTSKSVTSCAARFAIESMLPRVENPLGPAPLGTATHSVLERFFDRPAEKRTLTLLRRQVKPVTREHLAAYEGTPEYDDMFAEVHKTVGEWAEGIYSIENPQEINVFRNELAIKGLKLSNGVPFIGFLDRTRIDGDPDDMENADLHIDDYKGLALDTPIPTPAGWTTVADLKVGDEVYSPSGKPTKVLLKSEIHNRPCYELTFEDGSKVISDHVHDWVVHTTRSGTPVKLQIEAQHLFDLFHSEKAPVSVENTRPIDGNPAGLGSADERLALIRKAAAAVHSHSTRIEVTGDEDYVQDVYRALTSLGVTAIRGMRWGVPAVTFDERDVDSYSVNHSRRALTRIRKVPSVPTQCIKVDAPEEMFLCGDGFVPTHNTGKKVKRPSQRFGDEYGDQMRIYNDAITVMFGKPAATAQTLWPRQGQVVPVDLSPAAMRATLAAFARGWDYMNSTADAAVFPAVPSALCGWCPAANSCPVATIKTDNARANARKMHGGPEGPVDLGIPTVRTFTRPPMPGGTDTTGAPRMDKATDLTSAIQTLQENTVTATEKLAFPNNKWGVMAAMSVTDTATTHLDIWGQPLKPITIHALATVLGGIVEEIHKDVFMGGFDWSFDSASRVVYSLNASLRSRPAPFGQDADEWQKWRKTLIALTATKLRVGVALQDVAAFGEPGFDALIVHTVTPQPKNAPAAEAEPALV